VIDVGAPFFITVNVTVVFAGGFDVRTLKPRTIPLVVIVSHGSGGPVDPDRVAAANAVHAGESGPYRVVPLGPKSEVEAAPE
jgi:hypothetical protein